MTLMSVKVQTRTGNRAVMRGGTAALDLSKMDVVYVVRAEESNDDLRYSLRSLANLPHRKVFIAGYVPAWLRLVVPVYRDQEKQSNQENSNLNLLEACKREDLSDNFIFMNDDFFIVEKLKRMHMLNQGPLDDIIARYKSGNRMGQAWSLIATRDYLQKAFPGKELLSYELHTPMVMNKRAVLHMFEHWPRPVMALRPRTFYGNVYSEEGVETTDVKTTSWKEGPYVSTVYGETDDPAHNRIRATFSTPSKYESGTD